MKNKKLKTMVVSLTLAALVGAGATLAYLTDDAGTLTNKFTFTEKGINIKLDEAKVGEDNKALESGERVDATGEQEYKNLLPNMLIDKDPTVTVEENSVNSNVFVSVTNANVEANLKINDFSSAWKEIDPADYELTAAPNTKYYVYDGAKGTGTIEADDAFKVVPATAAGQQIVLEDVFTQVQVGNVTGTVTFSDIVIKAAAVQADSCSDGEAAATALGMLGAE